MIWDILDFCYWHRLRPNMMKSPAVIKVHSSVANACRERHVCSGLYVCTGWYLISSMNLINQKYPNQMETRNIAERNRFSHLCKSESHGLSDTHLDLFALWQYVWVKDLISRLHAAEPDKVGDKSTHSASPLSVSLRSVWFLLHIRQTASLQPPQTRPGLAPYAQPRGWLPDIRTWHHRIVIKSICLLPSSPSLDISLSLTGILSLFLSTLVFVCTFLFLFVYPLSPSLVFVLLLRSLSPSPFFSLVSDLSLGLSMASLLKWNVNLIARLKTLMRSFAGLLWPKSVFYGHSRAEDLLFVVVMTCRTV